MKSNGFALLRALPILVVLATIGCGLPDAAGENGRPPNGDIAAPDPDQPVSNLDPTPLPPDMCQEEQGIVKRVTVVLTMESYPPQYVVRDDGGTEYFLSPTAATPITLPDGSSGDVDALYANASRPWEVSGDWQVPCEQERGDVQNASIKVLP